MLTGFGTVGAVMGERMYDALGAMIVTRDVMAASRAQANRMLVGGAALRRADANLVAATAGLATARASRVAAEARLATSMARLEATRARIANR